MATRGTSIVACYMAWDTTNNVGKTGDSGNHTLKWVKDGTSATATNAAAEVDSTNCPGLYKVTLTTTETTCDSGTLHGKSSTSAISIMPISFTFEQNWFTSQMTEAYAADNTAPTLAQALFMIQQFQQEKAIAATTMTVKKLDGSTTAATFTLDSATAPTSITRAT